jgi:hypothetical protein
MRWVRWVRLSGTREMRAAKPKTHRRRARTAAK